MNDELQEVACLCDNLGMKPGEHIEAGSLRVSFVRRGDRYGHTIDVAPDDQDWQTVFTSIEGASNESWPKSPPLQQLHIESREAGKTVALLVGMAGPNHWSASIEADPAAATLTFDVACRVRHWPGVRLGSEYQVGAAALADRIAIDCDTGCRSSSVAGIVKVHPGIDVPEAIASVRWKYRLSRLR